MVDRIEKLDPNLYRVQEAGDDQRRRQQQQEEENKKKDKDKFEKKGAGWKRLVPGSANVRTNPLMANRPAAMPHVLGMQEDEPEESSLTFSERLLVAWGILDRGGRPRIPIIFTYLIVLGVIALGSLLIGVFVWR